LGVDECLYQETSDALFLEKLVDCRFPDINTISHETMEKLLTENSLSHFIIDCRFEYEYEGGHIKGALNLNSPLKVEEYFFKNRE
jgi:predicted sulfurtransferase